MASRSFILLLLRLRCDKRGQSLRAPRPLLIRLSLSSSFLSFGNLGKPLSVVRPTLIRLSVSKFAYSSVRPSICVARALSRFNSLTWKFKIILLLINLNDYVLQNIKGLTVKYANFETLSLINDGLTTLKGFPKFLKLKKLQLSNNRTVSCVLATWGNLWDQHWSRLSVSKFAY